MRNVGGTTKRRFALSSQADERAFLLAEESNRCYATCQRTKREKSDPAGSAPAASPRAPRDGVTYLHETIAHRKLVILACWHTNRRCG